MGGKRLGRPQPHIHGSREAPYEARKQCRSRSDDPRRPYVAVGGVVVLDKVVFRVVEQLSVLIVAERSFAPMDIELDLAMLAAEHPYKSGVAGVDDAYLAVVVQRGQCFADDPAVLAVNIHAANLPQIGKRDQ